MHVRPKKALGQHFLHDSTVAARIVEALLSHWPLPAAETGIPDGGPDTGSLRSVVEVGPGTGVLTTLLLPTEGEVLVDGMDTRDEAHTLAIRQRVGMVFQNPDNQIVTTVVEEDVGFGPENLGVPTDEIRSR
ncbi:MAG TPA: rRNA adenine N-6-methyltransferase family protein, partial [Bacteroidales bacterium]|nr:rRNA adenine N-6-methyltransferase family protein [Bacteroidales bacterium]